MNRTAFLCLFLYNAAAFVGGYIADVSIKWMSLLIPLLLLGALGLTVVLDQLYGYVRRRKFKDTVSTKQCRCTFLFVFAVTLGILAVYYYAFFPGAYTPDSYVQLDQAFTRTYSDWHPFIHTFLFFTVPLRLFGAEEAIVFLQILYFAFGFSYLIATIRKYGCPKGICAVSVLLVVLAPVTGHIMMYPWKDCGLAIFSTVSTAHYVHIVMTQGAWLGRKRNILACGIFWVLTMLVRHNAVLFVFLMIALSIWIGWKNRRGLFLTTALSLAVLFLIKGPLYNVYSVEKPGERLVETTGMCMVIMGNVLVNCPDALGQGNDGIPI